MEVGGVRWEDELIRKCYEVLARGGEVHVQFSKRVGKEGSFRVPIIKVYVENQVICKEVKIVD